jgi:thiol-disulfide isomerase/thioredoxin
LNTRSIGVALAAGLLLACRPAPADQTLLFFRRSPVAAIAGHAWAPDPDHSRIIEFRGLVPVRALSANGLTAPVAVSMLVPDLLVTEMTGEGVVLDTAGRLLRDWPSPHPIALYATGGGRIVAARSPYRVPAFLTEPDTAPLLKVLDTLGRPLAGLGAIRAVPFLTEVVNAGAIAVANDAIYFAPLVRDEITKLGLGGNLIWTTKRGLYAVESDPQYLPNRGRVIPVQQAIVNIALALGPDGRLYVLGAADSGGTRLRLDVLDTASGRILATRDLGPHETAIALGRDGQIVVFDADSVAAALPGLGERPPFTPPFALATPAGDTVRLADYAGKVTLVNFWASWCGPCRQEFPHMAHLSRSLAGAPFAIAAISDDVDAGAMRRFLAELKPPFPILVGGGRMKEIYHYRGLPYSLLLDRRGRVIERIFGFGGATEFTRLRESIAKEIANP